ncbi:MAG: DUF3089 domain-containing protein [Thermodesulfobacteriota bacterium]
MRKNSSITLAIIAIFCIFSCAGCDSSEYNTSGITIIVPTDYSQAKHWLEAPSTPDKTVDVFYVYPTAYSKASPSDPNFCAVNNAKMMQGAKAAYQRQAVAFAPYANIYAPFYRQVDAAYQLALPFAQQDENIQKEPLIDVTAAFEYFLQHYNNGRPFILVGHSQGSAVLKFLLSGYMEAHPDVYQRMIAAYVVGQSITPEYLAENPHLKFATGGNDTGVIVSWNTEAPVLAITNPVTQPGGIAINPITWTTEEVPATAQQNRGSLQLNPATGGTPVLDEYGEILRVTGLADACVNIARGVVICSTVNEADYNANGIYHTYDYPFYFFNVRQNAADRIQQYFTENGGN